MEIRARRDTDFDELVSLAAQVHAVDGYPIYLPDEDYHRFLTSPRPVAAWVAINQGQLVGHVALNTTTSRLVMRLVEELEPNPPAVYVARLLVDRQTRRRGIGHALLEHARNAAADAGWSAFLDVVDTASAQPAIALYRGAGWEEVGRASFERGDEPVDEIVFRCPLR